MKKKITVIILVFLVAGTVIRIFQVAPSGGGRETVSPDKKYVARADDFYGKGFWGGTNTYYEFTVRTAEGRRVQHIIMDEPPQGMIDWREDGSMQWTSNSSSVTYSFKGGELTLSVVP